MKKLQLIAPLLALLLCSCSGLQKGDPKRPVSLNGSRSLSKQLRVYMGIFVDELHSQGIPAMSRYALFIPQGSIDKRYRSEFTQALKQACLQASNDSSLSPLFSAQRVFLIPQQKLASSEKLNKAPAERLAAEYTRGSHEGWTAIHSYWSHFNRLAVGDRSWIDELPDSIRADLGQPLGYLMRAELVLDSEESLTSFKYQLSLQMVEVGTEHMFYSNSFPVNLTRKMN